MLVIVILILILVCYLLFNKNSSEPITVKKSSIHGFGLFATEDIIPNREIFTVLINKQVIDKGRYINHSWTPNTILKHKGKETYKIVSKKNIKKGDELTADYRYTPDYIYKPDPNWK